MRGSEVSPWLPLAPVQSDLLPPLHVFRAPLVVDVEESFAGTSGLRVNISVVELVTNNTVGLRVQTWQHLSVNKVPLIYFECELR